MCTFISHNDRKRAVAFLLAILLNMFLICTASAQKGISSGNSKVEQNAGSGYRQIEWIDLMPAEDLEALKSPPESLILIEDGSAGDQISSQIKSSITQATDSRYQEALVSTRVVDSFNGQKIRVPGFVVPLEFGDDQTVTTFFIVPYFGACIHMPPPPPNQIIFASFEKGLTLTNLYDPVWVSGVLSTKLIENDMATAAYSLEVAQVSLYID